MLNDLLRRSTTTAALLLVAGAATVVLAQNQAETSSWRIPGWSFTPGVTLSEIFDSNVALASAPADTRQTQSDQVFIMEPFGTLDYLSRRTQFSGSYRGFVRRYMEVDQLNGFTQSGAVSARHLATRHLSFYLQDTYSHVPTTDEVELNGVPFTRTGSRTNSLDGRSRCATDEGHVALGALRPDVGQLRSTGHVPDRRLRERLPHGFHAPLQPADDARGGIRYPAGRPQPGHPADHVPGHRCHRLVCPWPAHEPHGRGRAVAPCGPHHRRQPDGTVPPGRRHPGGRARHDRRLGTSGDTSLRSGLADRTRASRCAGSFACRSPATGCT